MNRPKSGSGGPRHEGSAISTTSAVLLGAAATASVAALVWYRFGRATDVAQRATTTPRRSNDAALTGESAEPPQPEVAPPTTPSVATPSSRLVASSARLRGRSRFLSAVSDSGVDDDDEPIDSPRASVAKQLAVSAAVASDADADSGLDVSDAETDVAPHESDDDDDSSIAPVKRRAAAQPVQQARHAPRGRRSGAAAQHPVFSFVFTGGPCAGKTTVMAKLAVHLRARGFLVYTVPEAATMLFTNGATFDDYETEDKQLRFQANLLKTQMHLEDTFYNLAVDAEKPAVLLCDRGTMDGSAYITTDTWRRLLAANGFDEVKLRDRRYDAVIHMVTAADGALEYYTLANNEARKETPEEAIALDRRLQQAWVGHSQPFTIDNSTSFAGKVDRVVNCVDRLVGLPQTRPTFRKFVLRSWPDLDKLPFPHVTFQLNKVYLKVTPKPDVRSLLRHEDESKVPTSPPRSPRKNPDRAPYAYVRRRRQVASNGDVIGVSSFGFTSVHWGHDGQKVELKRIITQREYKVAVQQQADPERRIVRQTRTSFLWKGRYYEVWLFRRPCEGLCVLACQDIKGRADATPSAGVPPGFIVDRDVSGDKMFSAYHLSLRTTGLVV